MTGRRAQRTRAGVWAALLAGCASVQGQSLEVPADVQQVELTVDTGSVTVLPGSVGSRVQVHRRARAFPDTRAVHDDVSRGVLKVDARCGGAPGCRIDHDLRVPPNVRVIVQVNDGDVELDGVTNDLEITVGLGKVTGTGLGGGAVDVRTEGGAIDLIFARAPRTLAANAAAGDVSLRLPAGAYRCDLDRAQAGEIGVTCDDAAPNTIAASTGVGKLRVRASP